VKPLEAALDRLNAILLRYAPHLALIGAAVGVLAGANAVLAWGISKQDEVFVWSVVRQLRWGGDLSPLIHRAHSPLSYLLFARLPGSGHPSDLVWMRLANVGLYALAVAVLALLARRLRKELEPDGRLRSLAAAALDHDQMPQTRPSASLPVAPVLALAFVPRYHDLFEARAYPLYALLGLAAALGACVVTASERRPTRFAGLMLFGLASVAALYTHAFASWLVLSLVLGSFWVNGWRSASSWALAGVAALAAVLWLPWLLLVMKGKLEGRFTNVDDYTFPVRALPLVACWLIAAVLVWRSRRFTPASIAFAVLPFAGWLMESWGFVIAVWAHLDRRRNGAPTSATWRVLIAAAALPQLVQTATGVPYYHMPSVLLRTLAWSSMLSNGRGTWAGRAATLVFLSQFGLFVTTAFGHGLSAPINEFGPWPGLLTGDHPAAWPSLQPMME